MEWGGWGSREGGAGGWNWGRKAGAGLHRWYLEVDEDGGGQHPKALQKVPQHVHKGRPDAGVPQGQGLPGPLLQRCILCPPGPVAVVGPGLVQHKGHSEGEAEQLSPGDLLPGSSAHFHTSSSHLPRSPLSIYFLPIFPVPGKRQYGPRETSNAAWGQEYVVPEAWIQILALLLK